MSVVTAIENGQPDGGYLLKYGRLDIPFKIEFQPRSQLTFHVHPEMRLEVLAPEHRSREAILVHAGPIRVDVDKVTPNLAGLTSLQPIDTR